MELNPIWNVIAVQGMGCRGSSVRGLCPVALRERAELYSYGEGDARHASNRERLRRAWSQDQEWRVDGWNGARAAW